MKISNISKIVIILLFMLFLSLYIAQASGYYEYQENKKVTLTKEAIKDFEKDLKEGKNINVKNYLQEEKHYNNKASILGLQISNFIENSFNSIMSSLFNQINKEISTK